MWKAAIEFVGLVVRAWWAWLGLVTGAVGVVGLLGASVAFPAWAWLVIGFGLLTVAQFSAFKRVRTARDNLQAKLDRPLDISVSAPFWRVEDWHGDGYLITGLTHITNLSPQHRASLSFSIRFKLSETGGAVLDHSDDAADTWSVPAGLAPATGERKALSFLIPKALAQVMPFDLEIGSMQIPDVVLRVQDHISKRSEDVPIPTPHPHVVAAGP